MDEIELDQIRVDLRDTHGERAIKEGNIVCERWAVRNVQQCIEPASRKCRKQIRPASFWETLVVTDLKVNGSPNGSDLRAREEFI
jgi:hypothetical protein